MSAVRSNRPVEDHHIATKLVSTRRFVQNPVLGKTNNSWESANSAWGMPFALVLLLNLRQQG